MKKLYAVLMAVLLCVALFAGCQWSAEPPTPMDAILTLFEEYAQTESGSTGNRIMLQYFYTDPALVLEALTVTDYSESILILIGSTIARKWEAFNDAISTLDSLELNEDAARMLGYIHANIDYWANH